MDPTPPDDTAQALALQLHADMVALRGDIAAASARAMVAWGEGIADPGVRASVANMADYLALRRVDLRGLQRRLAVLGLSSLGRAEPHVRPSIDAVIATLTRITRLPDAAYPGEAAFDAGPAMLARRRDALFGAPRPGSQCRIMATLPSEAAEGPALLRALAAAGVDTVRINCAHDGPAAWAAMVAHTRAAAEATGRRIAVACDLAGPKVRTLKVDQAGRGRLRRGDRLALVRGGPSADAVPQATLSHPELIDLMREGTPVWFDDGKLRTRVVERRDDSVLLEVVGVREKGVKLKPEKGVNLPGVDVTIAALTDKDRADLEFVAKEADIVGFSFVQTVVDVRDLVAALDAHRGDRPRPGIMLKVETELALHNLPQLIVAAGAAAPVAVMIARGDLAVEIGLERLSEIQDEILWLCEAAHVPVVWATQVLDGLLHDGMASRAETTDAAMGQRAECVMLNKGPYLAEAVRFLGSVLGRMDRHQAKKFARLGPLSAWKLP